MKYAVIWKIGRKVIGSAGKMSAAAVPGFLQGMAYSFGCAAAAHVISKFQDTCTDSKTEPCEDKQDAT